MWMSFYWIYDDSEPTLHQLVSSEAYRFRIRNSRSHSCAFLLSSCKYIGYFTIGSKFPDALTTGKSDATGKHLIWDGYGTVT